MQKLLNIIVYTYWKLNNLPKRPKYASLNVSNIKYIPILIITIGEFNISLTEPLTTFRKAICSEKLLMRRCNQS